MIVRLLPRRFNDNPNSGMTQDDLGRYVCWEDYKRDMQAASDLCNTLAKILSYRCGKSAIYWMEYAKREVEKK